MDVKSFHKGAVIFKKGDPSDGMYEIQGGSIGIFSDYGGPNEKKIAHLVAPEVVGEMGLLDNAPRSATAVALEDGTALLRVTEEDFNSYFEKNPAKVLHIMQQMCSRLRNTTQDYLYACRTVYETVQTEKAGKQKSPTLLDKIKKICEFYKDFDFYGEV